MSSTIDQLRDHIQQEAMTGITLMNYNAAALLPTGTGKSRVMAELTRRLCSSKPIERIIYTCDNQGLRDKDFPLEMEKWGCADILPKIERMCYAAAYKIRGNHYDLWLGDEIDYMITPKYYLFATENTFDHKILLTGTISDEKRPHLQALAPIVYERSVAELERLGVLNKSKYFKVAYVMTPEENNQYIWIRNKFIELYEDRIKNAEKIEALVRKRKLFLSSLRSSVSITQQLIHKLYWKDMRLLVFARSQDIADAILPGHSYHGGNHKDNNLERFNRGEIPAVCVIGKVDRGANLSGVNLIIHEAPGASITKYSQQRGRGKRLAADQTLYEFFIIPYYYEEEKDLFGNKTLSMKPTVVEKWVNKATEHLDTSNIEYFTL